MRSDNSKFRIIKYRLKTGNQNILLVQCFFIDNELDDKELIFLLGKKRLVPKISTKEGIEIRKKHLADSYGIDKEYYFWIPLPEKLNSNKCIRIFEKDSKNERLVYTISCSKILKLRTRVDKYVEEAVLKDGKIEISGWYISSRNEPIDISVLNKKDEKIKYELKEVYRKDVLMEYPECKDDEIHGFKLLFEDFGLKNVRIVFCGGEQMVTYESEIYPSKVKKIFLLVRKIFVKTVAYTKSNGIKDTFKRIIVKLFRLNETSYSSWMKKNCPTQEELEKQRHFSLTYTPKISIVVPLYKTPLKFLEEFIDSVKCQTYSNWELCLSDGSGKNSPLRNILQKYSKEDTRIKIISKEEAMQISENTNMAMGIATGEFIAFSDHDDILTPDALFECAKALNEDNSIDVLYSDEDKVSMDGREYFEPHFKTDFNIDLLCSMNYICHLFVVKKDIVDKVGLLRTEYDGAQDYDFVLRCVEVAENIHHIPKVLYHWRAHKDSTSENPQSKMYAFEAGARAIQAHYDRVGIHAKVHQGEYLGLYKTEHILGFKPMISIIIPNKDHIEDLEKCISSIEKKSKYENYEYIIIENNSEEKKTFQYYEDLKRENPKVKVIYWEKEFNYSAINNYGVKVANGEFLLFLNNDTEIINDNCLEELVGYCMHDTVGAVGARLYYEDDTIQHAGVIVGFGGVAGHAFIGLPRNANGYFSRIICAQDLSAVTAACMMVKKSVFEQVGGFDETLKVAFNDIDLCMKIRQAGYLIVYNPYAELYHYESKSRGLEDTKEKVERFNNEIALFAHKWPDILKNGDPYYNPNLSMERCDFSLK